jgi:hypothetical protein
MTTHIQTSQSLSTQSTTDTTQANEYKSSSFTSKTQADEFYNEAQVLKLQSEEDESLSLQDEQKAQEFTSKAKEEKTSQEALKVKISSEEAIYKTEIEKASTEGTSASSNTINTESDGVATSICEFIPFIDIVCDIVGSIAAVGFESNVAKLSTQSAVDYAAAANTKEAEDVDVEQLNAIQNEMNADVDIASGLTTKSEQEHIKSEEELQQSNTEMEKGDEQSARSKEEELESEEEMTKAEEEELEANQEMEKAMEEGMEALKDAALAGIVSVLVLSFFAIRMMIAVVIPVAASMIGFIPRAMAMPNKYGTNTVTRPTTFLAFLGNLWTILPKQEVSYFVLHCGVFISTMSTWFYVKFQHLENYTMQSRGGILLFFAFVAGCVQGGLLHALPHFVIMVNSRWRHYEQIDGGAGYVTSTSMTSISLLPPTSYAIIIGGTILKLIKAIVYLTPLFIIEITTLWLLLGRCVLTFHLPLPFTTWVVGVTLFMAGIIYIVVFEIRSSNTIDSKQAGVEVDIDVEEVDVEVEKGCEDEFGCEEDCSIVPKASAVSTYNENVESTDDIINETKNLIQNDYNNSHNRYRYQYSYTHTHKKYGEQQDENKSHNLEQVASLDHKIEMNNPGEGTNETTSGCASVSDSGSICESQISSKCSMDLYQSEEGIAIAKVVQNENEDDAQDHCGTRSHADDYEYESVPLLMQNSEIQTSSASTTTSRSSSIDRSKPNAYSSYMTTQKERTSKITNEDRKAQHQQNSACKNVLLAIEQYVSDLKLPFEIFIMTFMIVLMQGCIPILMKL